MYQHERKRKKPEVKTHNSTYCKKCKEDFLDEEDFFQHNSEAHGVERDGSYRCFGCGKLFNVRVSCLMHESRRCPQLVNGYECTLCNTFSQTRYHHEKHMRDHRQNNTMEVPSQEPNEHAFRCSKCGEEFTMKSEWSAHLKQHSINKEYICETCGKGFANISFLNLHRSRHMGERKYQCAHCDYRCTEKAYLAIHLRKHTKEKPYACDLCPVLLSTSSSLKRHRQSHFGVKPFVCTYGDCDKKFSGRKSLKEHIEVIHERTASHPCTLCDQEFLRAGGLRRHKKQKHPEEA
ncbi:myoneurin-like [Phthorimaea operculella]|nr:myoneurin-like [Phthorimaea operculella]